MSHRTEISWCDSTFNPWMGCTKVSPACDHCYAERDTKRFGIVQWGAGQPRKRTSAANWKLPERWNQQGLVCVDCATPVVQRATGFDCECGQMGACGQARRRRVFCASLADWLDNEVPIEWIADLLDLIRRTPNLDWLLLSKRVGNWRKRIEEASVYRLAVLMADCCDPKRDEFWQWIAAWRNGNPPQNIWIGATVVNQEEVDRDVPRLLTVPARVRFLSVEPMLSSIDLRRFLWVGEEGGIDFSHTPSSLIDWVIVGGESGPHARPMRPDWVRSLRDQCEASGTPFHFKQWGEWEHVACVEDSRALDPTRLHYFSLLDATFYRCGKKAAGRILDGRAHDAFPVPT